MLRGYLLFPDEFVRLIKPNFTWFDLVFLSSKLIRVFFVNQRRNFVTAEISLMFFLATVKDKLLSTILLTILMVTCDGLIFLSQVFIFVCLMQWSSIFFAQVDKTSTYCILEWPPKGSTDQCCFDMWKI